MEKNNESDWRFLASILVLFIILKIIELKFPIYFFDFFTLLIVLTGISILVWIALKMEKLIKLSLLSLSIFLFLHLVLFPFLYLIVISKNPESVEFDGYVFKTEQAKALNDLNSLYGIDNLKKQIFFFRMLESAPDSVRNLRLEELKKRNISYRDWIIGLKLKQPKGGFNRPNRLESLVFYNSRMTEMTYVLNRPEINIGGDNTIDNYRQKFQPRYEKDLLNYNLEQHAINHSQITYQKVRTLTHSSRKNRSYERFFVLYEVL